MATARAARLHDEAEANVHDERRRARLLAKPYVKRHPAFEQLERQARKAFPFAGCFDDG